MRKMMFMASISEYMGKIKDFAKDESKHMIIKLNRSLYLSFFAMETTL
jgi:hypothetical protein